MLIKILINLLMEDLLDGRRAVTFKGCTAIELVVKIRTSQLGAQNAHYSVKIEKV
jgi:hypothetical protein